MSKKMADVDWGQVFRERLAEIEQAQGEKISLYALQDELGIPRTVLQRVLAGESVRVSAFLAVIDYLGFEIVAAKGDK